MAEHCDTKLTASLTMDHTHSNHSMHQREGEERPSKHRRVVASQRQSDGSVDPAKPLGPLQTMVRQWSQVPLSAFFESDRVETLVQEITRLLEPPPSSTLSPQQPHYEYRLLAQTHGLLLHWLDFAVGSQKVRDITRDHDAVKVQALVVSTAQCLRLLYQSSPWNLVSPESVAILTRALLKLKHYSAVDSESLYDLLIVLEVALRSNNVGSDRGLGVVPLGIQIDFLLCLVDTWTAGNMAASHEDGSTGGTEALQGRARTTGGTDALQGRAATTARGIVSHLQPSNDDSSSTTRSPHHQSTVSQLAEVAWNVMHEAKPVGTISANTVRLFQLQCLLRRAPSDRGLVDSNVVSTLLDAVLCPASRSRDDLTRSQAMDCLVVISQNQDDTQPAFMPHKLLSAFVHILTGAGVTPYDSVLKLKAVEGLQAILVNGDMFQTCMAILTSDQNPHVTMKMFVRSMMDTINYRCHGPLQDFDTESGSWMDWSTNSVVIAASEILLSVLSASFHEVGQSLSQSQLVSICIQLLQLQSYCEHIAYLAVRAICHEHPAQFMDVVQSYPDLLTSLADVLCYPDVATSTVKSILVFLQELLELRPLMSTVLVRQPRVLEAIAGTSMSNESNHDSETVEMRRMAATLLFVLSTDVCNRRILARHARVLSSMVSYVRDHSTIPATLPDGQQDGEAAGFSESCNRQVWKERILQLAAVL